MSDTGDPNRRNLLCNRRSQKKKHDDLKLAAEGCFPFVSTDFVRQPEGNRDKQTRVYLWGAGVFFYGDEAGDSPEDEVSQRLPTVFENLANVKISSVAVGSSHAVFLSSIGDVYSLGTGQVGQLGLGFDRLFAREPGLVAGLVVSARQIACGSQHTLVLTSESSIYTWGAAECCGNLTCLDQWTPYPLTRIRGKEAPLREQEPFSLIAAKHRQSVAVNAQNEFYVWGETFFSRHYMTPYFLFRLAAGDEVISVEIAQSFALGLTREGKLFAWGDATVGSSAAELDWLVGGELSGRSVPDKRVKPKWLALSDTHGTIMPQVASVAVGSRHAILLCHDGRMFSYGENFSGQCGYSSTLPWLSLPRLIKISTLEAGCRMESIAAGPKHSACLTVGGHLMTWGHASHHKLISTTSVESLLDDQRRVRTGKQMGAAVRSGLKESVCRPRLVYGMLFATARIVALGEHMTIVVTGEGRLDDSHNDDLLSHVNLVGGPRLSDVESGSDDRSSDSSSTDSIALTPLKPTGKQQTLQVLPSSTFTTPSGNLHDHVFDKN